MRSKAALVTLIALLIFALLLSGCGRKVNADNPLFAKLSELRGKVGIQDPGADLFTDAQTDSVLQENGQVQTGDNGRVRLDLSTGTIVRITPSTLFALVANQVSEEGLATRLKMEVGRLFIILKGGSMDVETPSGVASVRGSFMMVEVDPVTLDVLITCLEGHCSATNPAGTLEITTGQRTILFHKDPVTGVYTAPGAEPMTEEDFKKWLDENPEAADLYNQALATLTAMAPRPTEESPTEPPAEATATIVSVVPPTAASGPCIALINPPVDSNQKYDANITFEWESTVQPAKYLLVFTYPNGIEVPFETTETSMTRYFESMPEGGTYSWHVLALDANGGQLCKSGIQAFTKPTPIPQPTKVKKQESPAPYNPFCDPNSSYYDIEICTLGTPPPCPPSDPSYPWCYPPTQGP